MQKIIKYLFFSFIYFSILFNLPCEANSLTIQNKASTELKCQLNGIDLDNEYSDIQILPNNTWSTNLTSQVNQVDCNNLIFRGLKESQNHQIIYQSEATHTLNVLLYPYIPSEKNKNNQKIFEPLKIRLINEFQTQHPEIALNLVLSEDPALDPYTIDNFDHIFSQDGYDIVETDMFMLQDLIKNKMGRSYINILNKSNFDQDKFFSKAIDGVTFDQNLYAIPSWICMNYIYSKDPNIKQIIDLNDLKSYINNNNDKLLGIFNGSVILPSDYLNTYSATNNKSLKEYDVTLPIDSNSINNFIDLTNLCGKSENNCTNRVYKNNDSKLIEDFQNGVGNSVVGYSEFSFDLLGKGINNLYAIPLIPGDYIRPSIYVDGYIQNKSSCSDKQCQQDFIKFTNYMNTSQTRTWIALTEDLSNQVPRHLLPAINEFYEQTKIKNDSLYSQFYEGIRKSKDAMTNKLNENMKNTLYKDICTALKKDKPDYNCKLPVTKLFKR